MPGEDLVLGDQDVGAPVAVQVDEPQVGVVPRRVRQLGEGAERLPARVLGALVEPRGGPGERHQVELPVAGEVQQLLAAAAQRGQRRLEADGLERARTGRLPGWACRTRRRPARSGCPRRPRRPGPPSGRRRRRGRRAGSRGWRGRARAPGPGSPPCCTRARAAAATA